MQRQHIKVSLEEQHELIEQLKTRKDTEANRILRYVSMPDLSRMPDHPIAMMVERITSLPRYQNFDVIQIPEVVSTKIMFDTYNFPTDHPARSKSDTYYLDENHVLRPHTSIMWWYYLESPGIREKLAREGEVGVISYGKVYRKDEIDRSHYNVFHNIDAIYICEKSKNQIGRSELETVLGELTKATCGTKNPRKIIDDYNPYTDPTLEIEVDRNDQDLEILGSGVLRPELLDLLGLDKEKYNARARGPGLERILMPKMNIQDIRIFWSEDPRITAQWGNLEQEYQPVSKYPATYRDISFIISKNVHLNEYFDLVRDVVGDLVEEVTLLDTYDNEEKLGTGNISHTLRIVYRSHEKTLSNEEVNNIQTKMREETAKLGAKLR